ncbi:hypothetical protein F5B20DRAFT_526239 [Whalleya microplaca]|nr:hypothetical protein F5B20DRAFT_526239 [Whalleya microplaca]
MCVWKHYKWYCRECGAWYHSNYILVQQCNTYRAERRNNPNYECPNITWQPDESRDGLCGDHAPAVVNGVH